MKYKIVSIRRFYIIDEVRKIVLNIDLSDLFRIYHSFRRF